MRTPTEHEAGRFKQALENDDGEGAQALLAQFPALANEPLALSQHAGSVRPLLYACTERAYRCAKVLLDCGALQQGWERATFSGAKEQPLHWTIARNDQRMALLLIEHGAPLDQGRASDDEALPFQHAVRVERFEIAQMMIDKGFAVDHPIKHKKLGRTVKKNAWTTTLHEACTRNDVSAVLWLLERGANPLMKTASGQAPLGIAVANGNHDILAALQSWFASTAVKDHADHQVLKPL